MAFKAIMAVGILALLGAGGVFLIQVLEDRGAEKFHRAHLVRALNAETEGRRADAAEAEATIGRLNAANADLAERGAAAAAAVMRLEAAPKAGEGSICPADCIVQ